MSANSETIVKIQQFMSNLPNSTDNSIPNMLQNSFIISSTSNIDELQLQNMIANDSQQFSENQNDYYNYTAACAHMISKENKFEVIDLEDSSNYESSSIGNRGSSLQGYPRSNSNQQEKLQEMNREQLVLKQSQNKNGQQHQMTAHRVQKLPTCNGQDHIIIDSECESHSVDTNEQGYPEYSQQDQQLVRLYNQCQTDSEDEQTSNQCEDECNHSKESPINDKKNASKQGGFKIKKVKKNKSDKPKYQEYLIIPGKRYALMKEKRAQKNQNTEQTLILKMTQPIFEEFQFFLFCDIIIESKAIIGNKMQQSKRSDANYYKSISHITEYTDSNLFEISQIKNRETLMEFDSAKQYLLSLQDKYAKQVYDVLQNLQEKTRMGMETAMMIHNNQASLEFIMKRKEYAQMKYEEFKHKVLPNHKYYIYNHYLFDTRTGNIGYTNVGISKDFLNVLAINTDYFKVMMKKYGIIDFLKRDYKTAFTISYFNQYAYNMRNFPKIVRFSSEFITLDNIELKVDIEHQLVDLCREFDELNNFDCPFIDFVGFIIPQISDDIIMNLNQIREEQNIDIDKLIEMDEDEIDFYYNYESQQFIKKYYSDILNRDILVHNLKHQKLDFTKSN